MAAQPPALQDPQLYRPQTWLLLLTIVLCFLPLYLPLWTITLPAQESIVQSYLHRIVMSDTSSRLGIDWLAVLLTTLVLTTAFVALLALTQFRNRPRQVMLLNFALIFLSLGVAGKLYQVYDLEADPNGLRLLDANLQGQIGAGLVALLLAVVLLVLSRRFIQRDQKRVKNMDRFWS